MKRSTKYLTSIIFMMLFPSLLMAKQYAFIFNPHDFYMGDVSNGMENIYLKGVKTDLNADLTLSHFNDGNPSAAGAPIMRFTWSTLTSTIEVHPQSYMILSVPEDKVITNLYISCVNPAKLKINDVYNNSEYWSGVAHSIKISGPNFYTNDFYASVVRIHGFEVIYEDYVPGEKLSLNKEILKLQAGTKYKLTATLTPSNASLKKITWESSDTTVATVDNGTVNSLSKGVTTITATCGDLTATCKVKVLDSSNWHIVGVENFTEGYPEDTRTSAEKTENGAYILGNNIIMRRDVYSTFQAVQIEETEVLPEVKWTFTPGGYRYEREHDESTLLEFSFHTIGERTYTVKMKDAEVELATGIIDVISESPVNSVDVDPKNITMAVGASANITAKLHPEPESKSGNISWTSSNPSAVSVQKYGNYEVTVEALSSGNVDITATTTDGTKLSATCRVIANKISSGMVHIEPDDFEKKEEIDDNYFEATADGPVLQGKNILMRMGQTASITLSVKDIDILPKFKWAFRNEGLVNIQDISEDTQKVTFEAIAVGSTDYMISVDGTDDVIFKGHILILGNNPQWNVSEDFSVSKAWLPAASDTPKKETLVTSTMTGIEYAIMGCYCLNDKFIMINGKNYEGAYIAFTLPGICTQIDVVTSDITSTNADSKIDIYIDNEYVTSCTVNEVSHLYEITIPDKFKKRAGHRIKIKSGSKYYNQQFSSFFYHMAPKIDVDRDRIVLYEGSEYSLKPLKEGAVVDAAQFTWTSVDEKIAKVDAIGNVKALNAGETTVSVTDGNTSGECTIKVLGKNGWKFEGIENCTIGSSFNIFSRAKKTEDGAYICGNDIYIRVNTSAIVKLLLHEDVEEGTNHPDLNWYLGSIYGKRLDKATEKNTFCLNFIQPTTYTYEVYDSNRACVIKGNIIVLPEKPIYSFDLEPNSLICELGSSVSVTPVFNPADASIQTLKWSSSNNNIATVDNSGKITPIALGKCNINATATDGTGEYSTVYIEVVEPSVKELRLREQQVEISKGGSFQLIADYQPSVPNLDLRWSVDDKEVLNLQRIFQSVYLVRGLKPGKATITVKSNDHLGLTDTCEVSVVEAQSGIESIFGDAKDALFNVYDLQGRIVMQKATDAELQQLKPGLYIFRQGYETKRVLVK